jgi:hypothetical protein
MARDNMKNDKMARKCQRTKIKWPLHFENNILVIYFFKLCDDGS